jgi:hypothetical protein
MIVASKTSRSIFHYSWGEPDTINCSAETQGQSTNSSRETWSPRVFGDDVYMCLFQSMRRFHSWYFPHAQAKTTTYQSHCEASSKSSWGFIHIWQSERLIYPNGQLQSRRTCILENSHTKDPQQPSLILRAETRVQQKFQFILWGMRKSWQVNPSYFSIVCP